MALTVKQVEKLTKPGRYADGRGLYLQITPTGCKSWIFRYQLRGARHCMGLGTVELVRLEEARAAALGARKLVKAGVDPLEARRTTEAAALAAAATSKTFDECAAMYLTANRGSWKNAEHALQWENSVRRYVSPVLGGLAVHKIDAPLVIACLEPIWSTKPETANRVRGRIEVVLNLATTRGHRPADSLNPARWQGHLEHVFKRRGTNERLKQPALPVKQMPKFFAELSELSEPAARALALTILSASRTDEVLSATWSEFDFAERVWDRPADHMKAKFAHRVPLNDAMIACLPERGEPGERVFPLNDGAMLKVLDSMRYQDKEGRKIVVHGFRSTLTDWAAERTSYSRENAKMALAHTIGDKTDQSYFHTDLYEKRAALMQDWAAYCTTPVADSAGEVVPIRA
jgi:integrase